MELDPDDAKSGFFRATVNRIMAPSATQSTPMLSCVWYRCVAWHTTRTWRVYIVFDAWKDELDWL